MELRMYFQRCHVRYVLRTVSTADWPTCTALNTVVALQVTAQQSGHEGTTHTAAHRHCSLCAVLGSGRHNPTLMQTTTRVAKEAWRVRATSGVCILDELKSTSSGIAEPYAR